MRTLLFVLALGILAGCSQKEITQGSYTACNAYESALVTLADYREAGRLTESQVAKVNRARKIANPICTQGHPPQKEDAIQSLNNALGMLFSVKQEVENGSE